MLEFVKVPGENKKHNVRLYTLSTCVWCKRTKAFLKENKFEYEYVDIDLCSKEDAEKIRNDILSRGGRLSYPVTIVDEKMVINGFHEDRIAEALRN
jgi:glutaredoxin-like protein NrdH